MCALLVGLPDVTVIGVVDLAGVPIVVHVEQDAARPAGAGCARPAAAKGRRDVLLVDLPVFGRPAKLAWRKHRWRCSNRACGVGSWTGEDTRIAAPRLALTDRAGRWVTEQVGRYGRTVNEVAVELGGDWHTINDTVLAYGTALVDDDPARIGQPTAVGLDETLFVRTGEVHRQHWSTSIVDVRAGRLMDIVPGRGGLEPRRWFDRRGAEWCARVEWATLDLSGPYKAVFDAKLPDAVQVADPFHVIKLANTKLDECRRRVQNETLGHRGRKDDPLYRCRRLLTKAHERIDEHGHAKLVGLLRAGDPKGEVAEAWRAKEVVRSIYAHTDPIVAGQWVDDIARDFLDRNCPPEVHSLGRTIGRWREQIVAWHWSHVTNGPTEAANNLIKRIKRVAFGFMNFDNYRIRALLYAGRPNWDLLATITPR